MYSIFDNLTRQRVSLEVYDTAEEANHDYHMNEGHTHVEVVYDRETRNAFRKAARKYGKNAVRMATYIDSAGSPPYRLSASRT